MKRLLTFLALFPILAFAGTPLSLKYDSKTGATTDIPAGLTHLNFPAGFELQINGVPIGGGSGLTGGTSGHVVTASGATTIADSGTALSSLALDSAVVHKTGTETIAGVKTFTSNPIIATTGGIAEIYGYSDVNGYIKSKLTFDAPEDGVQGGIVSINSGDSPDAYGSYVQVFGASLGGGSVGIQIEAGDGKPGTDSNGADVLIYAGNKDGSGTSGSIKLFAGDPVGYSVELTPSGFKYVGVAGFAPTASGIFGYDSTSNTFKAGANGVAKTIAFTSDVSAAISDTAYDATSWDGVTTIAPSKNAVRDKIELLAPLANPTFTGTVTTGDVQVNGDFNVGTNGDGGTINIAGIPVNSVTVLSTNATVSRSVQFQDAPGVVAFLSDLSSYQPLDSDLTSWAGVTRASGFDTFTATPSGANLASLLTTALPDSKGGTGLTALGTGVATFLGTPSGANLASALTTALPASKGGTGLTSLGTGVATALGIDNNTAGGYSPIDGTATLSNKTLTAPKFANGGFIADANGNEEIIFTTTASAVNEITLANAATGNNPTLTASGGDTNISLTITPKGTGYLENSGGMVQLSHLRFGGDLGFEIYTTAAKARARTVSGRSLTLDRSGLHMASAAIVGFSPNGAANDVSDTYGADVAIARNAVGVNEINNGTAIGTTLTNARDLMLRTLTGATKSSGTDTTGGDLTLVGGQGYGTGAGGSIIRKTSLTTTTGSTAQTLSTRSYTPAKFVTLTESSATLFANIALASSKYLGAKLVCVVHADDGADFQALTSDVAIQAVNKGGSVTTTLTQVDSTTAASSGTLTVTYTAVANGNGVDIKANAVSSLTQTTLRIRWDIVSMATDDTGTVTAQ